MGVRIALFCVVGMACTQEPNAQPVARERLPPPSHATANDPFEPIPDDIDLDPLKVELGRRLFEEPRLSGDGTRTCVDCHHLSHGGVVPGEARSNHPLNETGPYNVPTVFNVGFNFRFNWQGSFETMEDHLDGPMMNEDVMGAGTWREVVERLRPSYDAAFAAAGYDEVSEASVRDAIVEYQRSLITPGSRFDRFLVGELELEEDERKGYELFKSVGCVSCHQGINIGGNLFQRFGVVDDAFEGREPSERDYGRMNVTGRAEDEFVFRVPSLRNVELTAPYFHNGSAETLDDAVRHMGRVQLGYVLSPDEVTAIVAFLKTLTGAYQGVPLGGERVP